MRGLRRRIAPIFAFASFLALSACAVPGAQAPGRLSLSPVSFSQLPGWQADHPAQAMPALLLNCERFGLSPQDLDLGGEGIAKQLAGQGGDWTTACAEARAVPVGDDAAARAFFERRFQPYVVGNGSSTDALFTGYFEPQVQGSRIRGGDYQTAVLRRPDDLVQIDLGDFVPDLKGRTTAGRLTGNQLVPYYTRAEIERGALSDRSLAIAWLADPIDAFFLQIQGSGRIDLPDGGVMRVGYAAQNGQKYVPIGRVLVEQGQMRSDQVSLQSIRAWLEAHPGQARALMDKNPSYVFFRTLPDLPPNVGAPGALGVPLTPDRSVAVDKTYIPLGAPVWVDTANPLNGSRMQRLMVAQDLGGAIKGPLRADIFFGWGRQAEQLAGHMRDHGRMYILLPRPSRTAETRGAKAGPGAGG